MKRQYSSNIYEGLAREYNFSDVSFFCRYFKKNTGKSPLEFRGTRNGEFVN